MSCASKRGVFQEERQPDGRAARQRHRERAGAVHPRAAGFGRSGIPQRYGKEQQELNTAVLTFLYKTPLRPRLKTPTGLWGGISSVQNNLPAVLRAGYFPVSLASGRDVFLTLPSAGLLLCQLGGDSGPTCARGRAERCPRSSGAPAAPPETARALGLPPAAGQVAIWVKRGKIKSPLLLQEKPTMYKVMAAYTCPACGAGRAARPGGEHGAAERPRAQTPPSHGAGGRGSAGSASSAGSAGSAEGAASRREGSSSGKPAQR